MITSEDADILVEVLMTFEEFVPIAPVSKALEGKGYNEKDVDRAMKRLGKMAKRDCGWL